MAPAAGGDAFEDLAVAGFVGLEGFGVGGGEVAGGDSVDLNVFRRPLVGEGLGELGYTAFGGGIGGDSDAALEAEEAGDVDDFSSGVSGHDVAGNELGELEDAGEVDLQDLLPAFERGVYGGIAVDGAGVVDEDIDAAEVGVHGGEEGVGAVGGGEVGLEGGGGAANCLRGFVCGAAVAVDGYGGSGFGECRGDSCAEAAGGSGDEGNFVVEAEESLGHEDECKGRD